MLILWGGKVLEDCGKLKLIRNHLCDWILLESETCDAAEFSDALIEVLENLRELKSRPPEINSWNESWFEAHSVFVYETFLYIIAALVKSGAYSTLHEIFTSHYMKPSSEKYGRGDDFEKFDCFYGYSNTLQILAPEGIKLYAPAAELIKRQADREDIPFSEIMQADLITLLMSFITPGTEWYPQTLHYSSYGKGYPFFIRAAQHRNFKKLSTITGIASADELRNKVKEGCQRVGTDRWNNFRFERNFWVSMNMDQLDSLK